MKILIADDEYHVIDAITLLVPWDKLGIDKVLKASSVTESKAIIENEQPEIVIIDIIMMDETGIDLVHFINRQYPAIKTIAVSGHSDFEYVRTMLTCGSIDYILKPIEADILICAISRAIEAWNNDRIRSLEDMRIQHQFNFISDRYSKTLLSKMLYEDTEKESYHELIKTDSGFKTVNTCKILFYDTNYFPMEHSGFAERLKQFEEKIQNHFSTNQTGTSFCCLNNPNEVVIVLYGASESSLCYISRIIPELFHNQIYPFHIGCSSLFSFPDRFKASFSEAKQAFFETDCMKTSGYIISCSVAHSHQQYTLDPVLENQILSALLIGKQTQIDHIVSQWLKSNLPNHSIPLYIVRNICTLFHESLKQWSLILKKWFPDFMYNPSHYVINYQKLLDDRFLLSPKLLNTAIVSNINSLFNELNNVINSTDVFHKIAYHMELNYPHKFSQAEYARLFFLNKDYMCRKFKQIYNVSMVNYLNLIRIENAKKLIRSTNVRIRDIACQVGFEDEKYFARMFKKLTGMTPSEYRNSDGQEPSGSAIKQ